MATPMRQVEAPPPSPFASLSVDQKEKLKLITDFTYPPDLAKFDWRADFSKAEDDFSKACSKEGALFRILKETRDQEGNMRTAPADKICHIKIRGFVRNPDDIEKGEGIAKVELISANMWIDGERACRMDMVIKYHADGTVSGDMMAATSGLDKSDPRIREMDDKTRFLKRKMPDGKEEKIPAQSGFWSNPELAYHARRGGKIEGMGRTLLSILTTFGVSKGMASFRMRTPTEHECRVVEKFYQEKGAEVTYVGADLKQPYGIDVGCLDRLSDLRHEICEHEEPWKPDQAEPPS